MEVALAIGSGFVTSRMRRGSFQRRRDTGKDSPMQAWGVKVHVLKVHIENLALIRGTRKYMAFKCMRAVSNRVQSMTEYSSGLRRGTEDPMQMRAMLLGN